MSEAPSPWRIRNAGHTAIALRDMMRAAPALFDMLTADDLEQLHAAAGELESKLRDATELACTRPREHDREIQQARG